MVLGIGQLRVPFWLKDTALWLQQKLSNQQHSDTFVLLAEDRHAADERLFERPEHCDAWLQAQQDLPAAAPGQPQPVVAGVQWYSDKTQVDKKGQQVWPVKVAASPPAPGAAQEAH